jgi:hypothetical protein
MSSSGFLSKASEKVIEETKALMMEKEELLSMINQRLKDM